MQLFAIISYPRTGSTYLIKKLNSYSNITCHSEIFHPSVEAFNRSFMEISYLPEASFFNRLWGKSSIDLLFELRNRDPKAFLATVFNAKKEAVGFKIFPGQNDKVINHLIDDKSIKKIFLIRENQVRSYVSEQLALKTGKWDRHSLADQPSLETIHFNYDDFKQYKHRIDQQINSLRDKVAASGQDYLHLTYEEITSEFPDKKISDYLGLRLSAISEDIDQKKQNPFPLAHIIENYSEVMKEIEDEETKAQLKD